MKLSCPEFEHGGIIPDRFSQYCENLSPPLDFIDVPKEARSLVLIMDDADAARGRLTHWIVFNIDASTSGFEENCIPENVQFGRNGQDEVGYAGPKPQAGEHRYVFHAYALDRRLDLSTGSNRWDIEYAMVGHVLDRAELMGRFAAPLRFAPASHERLLSSHLVSCWD